MFQRESRCLRGQEVDRCSMALGSLDGPGNQGEGDDDHEEDDRHGEGKRMGMDSKAVDVVELEMLCVAGEEEDGHDVGSIVAVDRAMR